MTLAETLRQKLAEWQPGDGRHELSVSDPGTGWNASLTSDHADALGCLVWEMTLRRTGEAGPADPAALRAWADRVACRATGLLETLKVIEVDAPQQIAMLRSQEPARREDDLFYYEVLLKGTGEANVRRYHASRSAASRREQTAYALTHEAIAKLAADLIAEK